MIQMMELVNKDIKLNIIMLFHMFNKLEERFKKFLDMKNIKKDTNQISRNEISNMWNLQYTEWYYQQIVRHRRKD